jgi:hypothetical protein
MPFAKEPFIAKTPDGPVNVDPKTPYPADHDFVQRFPDFFATEEELLESGDGQTVTNVQATPDARRGRVK